MNRAIVAEFADAEKLIVATASVRRHGFRPLDALTPVAVPEIDALIATRGARLPIRSFMAVAGFGVAILFYGLEWFSSVYAYPINAGGRPLNSWPVFLLAPFEVGMLAAAIAGVAAFLANCRLPRLNHPIFSFPGIERASQDRFFLVASRVDDDQRDAHLRRILEDAGALSIAEGEV
jgi:hypothetical protein